MLGGNAKRPRDADMFGRHFEQTRKARDVNASHIEQRVFSGRGLAEITASGVYFVIFISSQ